MSNISGCLICGKELIYLSTPELLTCSYCGSVHSETVECPSGHFICNKCHSSGANDLILKYCQNTTLTDPIEMANLLMKHPEIKMHGPEHHFLVPAVLLASWYNIKDESGIKKHKLELGRKRSEQIPGGFCGSHGNCGAGVGTGIFFSIITETTPLSVKTWQLSNMLTGTCLVEIAKKGGPRCCKRDTFTAIHHCTDFIKENLGVTLPTTKDVICQFHTNNKQCTGTQCEYFRA